MPHEILLLGPMHGPTQAALEQRFNAHRLWEADDRAAMLAQHADIRAVATHAGVGIDAATLAALPALEIVSHFGVGIDAVDLPACTAAGVRVCNTPDVLTDEVADMATGLLLAAVRQIPQGDRFVRDGKWLQGPMPLTRSLQGRKVGIVGLGRIGAAIARRCAAFGCPIGYQGPREKPASGHRYFADVTALSAWADVLIAACPGGPATHHIVSRAALEALGPDGVFVNIARGSVVDQEALVELLADGRVGTAGLDVFADEPRVPEALIAMSHVVLQPHMGSASEQTRMAMGQLVVDNLEAFFANRPLLTPVN